MWKLLLMHALADSVTESVPNERPRMSVVCLPSKQQRNAHHLFRLETRLNLNKSFETKKIKFDLETGTAIAYLTSCILCCSA